MNQIKAKMPKYWQNDRPLGGTNYHPMYAAEGKSGHDMSIEQDGDRWQVRCRSCGWISGTRLSKSGAEEIAREHAKKPLPKIEKGPMDDGGIRIKDSAKNLVSNLLEKDISEVQALPTTNTEWGFYGTVQRNYGLDDRGAARAYKAMFHRIAGAMKYPVSEKIQQLLDSPSGRHLADQLSFHMGDPYNKPIRLSDVLLSIETLPKNKLGWFTSPANP